MSMDVTNWHFLRNLIRDLKLLVSIIRRSEWVQDKETDSETFFFFLYFLNNWFLLICNAPLSVMDFIRKVGRLVLLMKEPYVLPFLCVFLPDFQQGALRLEQEWGGTEL